MRIALDATSIPPKPVGVGNYLINLVHCLDDMEFEEEIVVIVHRSSAPLFGAISNAKIEILSVGDKSPFRRLIWEQTHLPPLLKKHRIDVLHSPHYTIPLAAFCRRVVTFHDMTFFLFPQYHRALKRVYFQRMAKLSSRLADTVIAISENTRQDILRLMKTPPQKVVTVPLGVNDEFHPIKDPKLLDQVRQAYHLAGEFFLYVGTLEPRKNVSLLLRAFRQYQQQGGRASLILVGQQGWMVEQLVRRLRFTSPDDQIRWLGYVPQADMPALYNLALALVYPSHYEGFGLPPLEAMACGVPVITTAVGALIENVGDAGLLIPPNDEDALAQAMLMVNRDQALRQRLQDQGLARAALYSWRQTAQKTLSVYRRFLTPYR